MTYQPINFSFFPQLFFIIAYAFCGGTFALFMYFLYDKKFTNVKNKDKINKRFIITLILAAALVVAALITEIVIKAQNRDIATHNILAKYNIQKIIWNDYRSSAYGDGSVKRNDPTLLVLVNNEEHVYRYEVNHETSEPTLIDVSQHSGKQTTPGPKAETLLKEKN